MNNALTFQTTVFETITRNSEPWVRGSQVGNALGYSNGGKKVYELYRRHQDEFANSMATTVKMTVGNAEQDVLIFSLRGCHLLAMFARTPVAKAFRAWVLDVLETLNREKRKPKQAALPAVPAHLAELDKLWRDFDQFRYQTYLRGQEFFERLREITSPLYKRVVYRGKPNPGLHTDYMIEGLHSPAWRFTEGLKDASGDFYFAILQAKAYAEAMTVMKD